MAKCEMKMPDEFLEKVSRLGNKTDEIVPKVLEAGGEVVLRNVRSNLASSIGRDTKKTSRSTGQLLGALGVRTQRSAAAPFFEAREVAEQKRLYRSDGAKTDRGD
jgi:hypothetical protein